jgi:hypothetical protein
VSLTNWAVVELGMPCGQVVSVCTWQLRSLLMADQIFGERAFGWVAAILTSMTVAWVRLLSCPPGDLLEWVEE